MGNKKKFAADDAAASRSADGPVMTLDSHVHLRRGDEHVQFQANTPVSETDLTEDEIDELTALRAIRFAE